jgi:hypothetical protein
VYVEPLARAFAEHSLDDVEIIEGVADTKSSSFCRGQCLLHMRTHLMILHTTVYYVFLYFCMTGSETKRATTLIFAYPCHSSPHCQLYSLMPSRIVPFF